VDDRSFAAPRGAAKPRRARRTKKSQRGRPLEGSADVVLRALGQLGLTDQMRRLHIGQQWSRAVGSHIAARTAVQSFGRGVLLVRAASSAWQNELSYLKADIIKKLNALLEQPTVKDIRVICGQIEAPKPPAPPAVVPDTTPAERAQIRRLSQPIRDPSTRAAFEDLLLSRCLVHPPSPGPPG
jgi:predicted nucleic acid-binding Zn ribbon protein